jgi:hypothetical protein
MLRAAMHDIPQAINRIWYKLCHSERRPRVGALGYANLPLAAKAKNLCFLTASTNPNAEILRFARRATFLYFSNELAARSAQNDNPQPCGFEPRTGLLPAISL